MKLIMKSVLMVLRGSQLSQQLLLIWNWNMQQFTAQSLIIFLYIRNKQQISKISIWWTEAFLFPRNENKQRPENISHFITSFTLQRAYIFSAAVTDDRLGMDQNGDKRPSYLRIRGIDLWIHILFEVAVTNKTWLVLCTMLGLEKMMFILILGQGGTEVIGKIVLSCKENKKANTLVTCFISAWFRLFVDLI